MADSKTEKLFHKALAASQKGRATKTKKSGVYGIARRTGIMCPSADALQKSFRIDSKEANQIRRLCKVADEPEALEALIEKEHPKTQEYVRRMHSSPYGSSNWRRTIVLDAINNLLEGYGVEGLPGKHDSHRTGPEYQYINMGDTYSTTLIYKRSSDRLFIGNWGDVVERNPRLFDNDNY